ncbi:Rhs element Vgr protein [Polaromonas sp. CF318]|uniref:type VI secretion system Vgr family protein n=1 Tax=Polaromonas sp. CF318 TaxID=1144318 RepID=UPI000270F94C|nr:type VI secretion system tip protein TssI/VgrG [Polaromonas sp. CF318]EJL88810.1 Rhs element Vgr protein [Polaromonas sp. CF318]
MTSLDKNLNAANKRFEFASDAYGADKFAVIKMTGFESISKPFRFELILVSDDAGIDFDKVLQNAGRLRIFAPDGASSTPYYGVLAEFDQLQQTDGYVFYRAVLVPRLWHLSLYQMSEVYLNDQSIPQIVEKVLKDGRLTSADYELKLSGSYRARSFVCQYQETHLDFLSRWMEKEGMYFFFDQDGRKEKLVIADNRSMHPAQAVKVLYRPVSEQDTGVAPDSVQDFVCRQRPLPRQVVLRDYNHRKASVELKVTEPVFDNGVGEVNLYGENFRNEEEGRRYAKLRAEEILCGAKVFTGEATAVGLRSGYLMEMTRHYRDDFNGRYLVTEIHHEGSQAAALLAGIRTSYSEGQGGETIYRNSFRAIPAATQFRPERSTPRPRVSGTMNATIDAGGPSAYAELDEYGQYKVQLPFDSSDKAAGKGSARVRMASPYSGSDHGMNFPLHKDAEVLLSFIDGNPDEPVILGAVPNSENPSIVNNKNPYENRISTKGGNQVFMSDAKGKEVMWLHSPFHNSTIGIGSTDPKGGGSIWTSTAGSSESLTVGSSNSAFIGTRNAISASFDTSATAGVVHKAGIGTSINWTLGSDVTWKAGRSVTLDDSETVSLKTDAKTQANNEVLISGGQRTAVKALVEPLKAKVKLIVGLNIAANIAVAAGAASAIGKFADGGKSAKDDGKLDPWTPYGYGVAAAQAGLGTVSTLATHLVVRAAANAIATALKADETYASNIKVNGDGIAMAVDSLVPVSKSAITIKKNEVGLSSFSATAAGTSAMKVLPSEIKLSANGVPGLTSNLLLSATTGTLSTANPAGTVQLKHPSGGSAKLDAEGFVAKSGPAVISAELGQGASMACGRVSSVNATPNQVLAEFGKSSLTLDVSGATLDAPGSTMTLNAAGLKVNGALVQLG